MFRSASSSIVLGMSVVASVALLGDAVVRAGWAEMLLLAPWPLMVLWGLYVGFFAPSIRTDAAGATVVNFLRRTRMGWKSVADVRMRYQVVFTVHDATGRQRLVRAHGGPVAGRPVLFRSEAGASTVQRVPPSLRDLALIREQWETSLRDGSATAGLRRSWDVVSLGVLVALIAWAACSVLIVRPIF